MIRYDPNSGEAWAQFHRTGGKTSVNAQIISTLARVPELTCEQIRDAIEAKHQTVSAQIRHLRDAGWIVLAGAAEVDGHTVNTYKLPEWREQGDFAL